MPDDLWVIHLVPEGGAPINVARPGASGAYPVRIVSSYGSGTPATIVQQSAGVLVQPETPITLPRQPQMCELDALYEAIHGDSRSVIAGSFRYAAKLTDIMGDLRPTPPKKVWDRLTQIAYQAIDVLGYDADKDDRAEKEYQFSRFAEITVARLPEYYAHSLYGVQRNYERAIEYSKEGSQRKLAFYEAEFAAFKRRWSLP